MVITNTGKLLKPVIKSIENSKCSFNNIYERMLQIIHKIQYIC